MMKKICWLCKIVPNYSHHDKCKICEGLNR